MEIVYGVHSLALAQFAELLTGLILQKTIAVAGFPAGEGFQIKVMPYSLSV